MLIWVFLWVCLLGLLFSRLWFGDGFWLWKHKLPGERLKEETKKKKEKHSPWGLGVVGVTDGREFVFTDDTLSFEVWRDACFFHSFFLTWVDGCPDA